MQAESKEKIYVICTDEDEPKLEIHIVAHKDELLEKSLIFQMLFRDCKVTTQENTNEKTGEKTDIVIITGTLAALVQIVDKLNTTLFQPPYIKTEAEKEALQAELTLLNSAIEAAKTKKKLRPSRNGFFTLKAKNTTDIGNTAEKPKKKSHSAERRRSINLSSDIRRASTPNPDDISAVVDKHNNSSESPPSPGK